MNVMHLIGSLGVGGAEQVVSVLVQGLRSTGIQTSVMAFDGGPLEKELHRAGVEVLLRPFAWPTALLWLARTARELRSRSIDVLHTHLFTTDQLGRIAGSLAGVPVVTTLHAPSTWKRSPRFKDRLKCMADGLTARHACDALVAISPEVRDYQHAHGGIPLAKMTIIGNPVHTERFRHDPAQRKQIRGEFGIGPDETVLTNVASLKPIKAQADLLRAMACIVPDHTGVKLLFVGDGPSRRELQTLSAELGLSEKVIFCGTRPDVPAHLSAADVFVMSSLSEGISMAILEAMAAGLPVVATAVGGNVDLVRDGQTGLLVPPQDPAALAAAITKLAGDIPGARALGERATSFVRAHYDAALIAGKYVSLYEETLRRTLKSKAFPSGMS